VGFRASCARRAAAAGLVGHVRNLPDGGVEAVFEGPDGDVAEMVAWCRRGPAMAAVTGVHVTTERPAGDLEFRIR